VQTVLPLPWQEASIEAANAVAYGANARLRYVTCWSAPSAATSGRARPLGSLSCVASKSEENRGFAGTRILGAPRTTLKLARRTEAAIRGRLPYPRHSGSKGFRDQLKARFKVTSTRSDRRVAAAAKGSCIASLRR